MSEDEAIAKLDAIDVDDKETAHLIADGVLEEMVPSSVRAAYRRVYERADGFWYA
jgi:glycine cleavage system pyridoxal-binding protein P